jgi:hypothetical protein
MKNKTDTLTPIYSVVYRHRGVGGSDSYFITKHLNDREWEKIQRTSGLRFPERNVVLTFLSRDVAIKAAIKLKKDPHNYEIRVLHYGFKERGFRPGEKKEKAVSIE